MLTSVIMFKNVESNLFILRISLRAKRKPLHNMIQEIDTCTPDYNPFGTQSVYTLHV